LCWSIVVLPFALVPATPIRRGLVRILEIYHVRFSPHLIKQKLLNQSMIQQRAPFQAAWTPFCGTGPLLARPERAILLRGVGDQHPAPIPSHSHSQECFWAFCRFPDCLQK